MHRGHERLRLTEARSEALHWAGRMVLTAKRRRSARARLHFEAFAE